jgi:hypothetical protein
VEVVERHEVMKSCRRGFMRWRSRDGPWGSHHDDASALKCNTSVGSTVEFEEGLWCLGVVVEIVRDAVGRAVRNAELWTDRGRCDIYDLQLRIDRAALVTLCGFIVKFQIWWDVRVAKTWFGIDVTKTYARTVDVHEHRGDRRALNLTFTIPHRSAVLGSQPFLHV